MNLDELHEEQIDLQADGTAVLPPQHAGCARLRPSQASSSNLERRRGFVARWFAVLIERQQRWYRGDIERQRHGVEEDARRLGGRVVWEDTQ